MLKRVVLSFFIIFITASSVFAGPFGLEMGMSLEYITKACNGTRPERLENDDRYLISPTKSHPDFEHYLVWVDETKGLYRVRAISTEVITSKYGTELKSFFHDMTERLSKAYGKPEIYDKINEDVLSVFKTEDQWMWTLHEGSRVLAAVWNKDSRRTTMPDKLSYVDLYADTPKYSYTKGYLVLEYEFENYDEVKNSQDDVF